MSLNNLGLGFVFTARDLASGAIQNLERNFLSLDRKVKVDGETVARAAHTAQREWASRAFWSVLPY